LDGKCYLLDQGQVGEVLMHTKTQAAFTLIELMITVAVLGVLLGLGIPAFRVWMQNTQVRNAADAILNGVQLARAEAVRRNMNVEFAMGNGAEWTVAQASPRTAIQDRVAEEGQTDQAQIDTQPAGATIVTFSPLGGPTLNLDASFRLRRVDIQAPGAPAGVRRLSVVISDNGSARMCDRDLPASDTRSC
jgi:type IV fimbrial biogenesis protein FimT